MRNATEYNIIIVDYLVTVTIRMKLPEDEV